MLQPRRVCDDSRATALVRQRCRASTRGCRGAFGIMRLSCWPSRTKTAKLCPRMCRTGRIVGVCVAESIRQSAMSGESERHVFELDLNANRRCSAIKIVDWGREFRMRRIVSRWRICQFSRPANPHEKPFDRAAGAILSAGAEPNPASMFIRAENPCLPQDTT